MPYKGRAITLKHKIADHSPTGHVCFVCQSPIEIMTSYYGRITSGWAKRNKAITERSAEFPQVGTHLTASGDILTVTGIKQVSFPINKKVRVCTAHKHLLSELIDEAPTTTTTHDDTPSGLGLGHSQDWSTPSVEWMGGKAFPNNTRNFRTRGDQRATPQAKSGPCYRINPLTGERTPL